MHGILHILQSMYVQRNKPLEHIASPFYLRFDHQVNFVVDKDARKSKTCKNRLVSTILLANQIFLYLGDEPDWRRKSFLLSFVPENRVLTQ
jgi:hypothetical protein